MLALLGRAEPDEATGPLMGLLSSAGAVPELGGRGRARGRRGGRGS
ncbi:hypothetical protein [Nocardioides sp. L-11A]|nr:hypothetical protein QJ852_11550 [Nocardioides sp. L-11A]